ncbi:fasciclin domain-containing protein [Tsuneonella sp. YG55]|uniref:Fasciclin domain-containing protein n=1 Tax=Tsuneonella litorea TaxID=2976475 RepID=A0A9X3AL78_9SPHN|nr:fasciclin domain-containing protein [Tsuneonella litorea]MCT2558888.1 fasciclin domain-containing protein [Tsuneonella litorea]
MISPKLKAASFAAMATMGAFALAAGAPAAAHNHSSHAGHGAEKSQKTIVGTAMGTGMHSTLVAAVKAADLVDTLSGPGPFTVFAPVDSAFAALPDGTVDTLLQPAQKGTLTKVLTYHVVAGRVPATQLVQAIRKNGGSYAFDTVAGEKLTARLDGETVTITDAAGRTSRVSMADVKATNGVIHVTDGVFLPA